MMERHLTVRVEGSEVARADRLALQSATTRSDVVRAALIEGLRLLEQRIAAPVEAIEAARRVVLGGAE
jgi:hypothetical protein